MSYLDGYDVLGDVNKDAARVITKDTLDVLNKQLGEKHMYTRDEVMDIVAKTRENSIVDYAAGESAFASPWVALVTFLLGALIGWSFAVRGSW